MAKTHYDGAHWILEDRTPRQVADILEWGRWYEKSDRHVAQDELEGGVRVSTVFLGLDHSFMGGPPVLFESMIFGGVLDQYQERYHTYEEAEAGHKRILALAKGEVYVQTDEVLSFEEQDAGAVRSARVDAQEPLLFRVISSEQWGESHCIAKVLEGRKVRVTMQAINGEDPVRDFAYAVLAGDPAAIDAVKDILRL